MMRRMKIDNRADALTAADRLRHAQAEKIADALLEAHLEGIDQARSLILQEKSLQEIRTQLDERRQFILSAMSGKRST
jgi:hypothetical protein